MGTKNNPGDFDCYAKAGDDEPIFTLRAKDPSAPRLIRQWASEAEADGEDPRKVAEARKCALDMEMWRRG